MGHWPSSQEGQIWFISEASADVLKGPRRVCNTLEELRVIKWNKIDCRGKFLSCLPHLEENACGCLWAEAAAARVWVLSSPKSSMLGLIQPQLMSDNLHREGTCFSGYQKPPSWHSSITRHCCDCTGRLIVALLSRRYRGTAETLRGSHSD